jgi:hypothetical protein
MFRRICGLRWNFGWKMMKDGLNSLDYYLTRISTPKHVSSVLAAGSLIGVTRYESLFSKKSTCNWPAENPSQDLFGPRDDPNSQGISIGVELFHPPAFSFLHQPFDPVDAWNSRGMANTAAISQSVSQCD